jgi:hypothetical protein
MQRLQQLLTQPRSLALLIAGLTVAAVVTTALAFAVAGPSVTTLPAGLGAPTGQRITIDQAQHNLQAALNQTGNSDLRLDEIMEFTDNFYAIVKEKSTGMGAFELLVDPYSGAVYPEYGPNMMWNAKYGMMSGGSMMGSRGGSMPSGMLHGGAYQMSVSASQAQQIAQHWLDQNQPGSTTEAPDPFYGYYTLHILKDGTVTGMLSVNGSSSQIWYHTWHGGFIQMREMGP